MFYLFIFISGVLPFALPHLLFGFVSGFWLHHFLYVSLLPVDKIQASPLRQHSANDWQYKWIGKEIVLCLNLQTISFGFVSWCGVKKNNRIKSKDDNEKWKGRLKWIRKVRVKKTFLLFRLRETRASESKNDAETLCVQRTHINSIFWLFLFKYY